MIVIKIGELFNDVKQIFEIENSEYDFQRSLLKTIGSALSCEWGALWVVNSFSPTLVPTVTWTKEGIVAAKLESHTKDRHLSLSEGNAGHVWRTREPIWTTDIVRDMCLPRSIDAKEVGLTGGTWFALKTEETVYGVIELLSKNFGNASDEILLKIESLGILIGKEIDMRTHKRKQ